VISKKVPKDVRNKILATMRSFAAEKAPNADIRRLEGRNPPEYRLRVGDCRAIFASDAMTITILRVADRREAYR
jgi:mRNA-degrading endonuclease RelE of RelBE toxin-antitoxin system